MAYNKMLKAIVIIIVVIIVGGGGYYLVQNSQRNKTAEPVALGPTATPSVSPTSGAKSSPVPTPTPTPSKLLPKVTTLAPTSVGTTAVNFYGKYTPYGNQITWWYEFGTTKSFGSTTDPKTMKSAGGSGASQALAPIYYTKLQPHTTYYYRLVVKTENGTGYGETLTFTTK